MEDSRSDKDNINWQDIPDAEKRLRQLRVRDEEFSIISKTAQYESRIEALEKENELLRGMQETWLNQELNRPPLTRRQLVRMLLKRL